MTGLEHDRRCGEGLRVDVHDRVMRVPKDLVSGVREGAPRHPEVELVAVGGGRHRQVHAGERRVIGEKLIVHMLGNGVPRAMSEWVCRSVMGKAHPQLAGASLAFDFEAAA
jgi:hypothetical protein